MIKKSPKQLKATTMQSMLVCCIPTLLFGSTMVLAAPPTCLSEMPKVQLPYEENTNFDNFSYEGCSCPLSDSDMTSLGISSWRQAQQASRVMVRYQLPKLSHAPDISILAVTYERGDSEMFTDLLTFKDDEFIDSQTVSYDEIAEGWLQSYSVIRKTDIITTDTSYVSETSVTTRQTYRVLPNGKIIAISTAPK